MGNNLKPCPYCGAGGKAEYLEMAVNKSGLVYVYCMFCGARGPLDENKDRAELKWNRRLK